MSTASVIATKASVKASEVNGDEKKKYTVYKVVVVDGKDSWFVLRRYNEFHSIQDFVKKNYPGIHLKLPGRKLFGSNFDPVFIRSRRNGLDEFIRGVTSHPELLEEPIIQEFLGMNRLNTSSSQSTSSDDKEGSTDSNGNVQTVNLGPSERPHARPSDFEFLKLIGKGSFGKVLVARHKADAKFYAVKVLEKQTILKRNEVAHIVAERNVLIKNLDHPFLVGLHWSFQTVDKLYFVLDYVNGGELFFHLQRERTFSESRARFYAAEIASALGYLHSEGIVYRDLKPENLLLDENGHVMLTDFGLCKEGLRHNDTTTTFCGTPEYLAPEVLLKQPYDRAVDWWCLGAVLYEMLCGFPPFYSRNTKEMFEKILKQPLNESAMKNLSSSAKDLLRSLLAKDKSTRLGAGFQDVVEIQVHDFFRKINWHALLRKEIQAPFKPSLSSELDFRNIDPEFTKEAVPQSVGQSKPRSGVNVSASVQRADKAFQGFSYAPPLVEEPM